MPRASSPGSSVTGDGGTSAAAAKENSSVSLQYPMLTRSNYAAWAIKMKVYLMAQGVWDAIDGAEVIDVRRDKMALAAIYQAIGEDVLLLIAEKETAREAWVMLKTMYVGADRVKEAKAQTLKTEFDNLRMKPAESVDEFAIKLNTIVNRIRGLGERWRKAMW